MIASISVLVAVMMISSAALPVNAMTKVEICKDGYEPKLVSPKRADKLIAEQGWELCPEIMIDSLTFVSGELICSGNDPTTEGLTPGFWKSNSQGGSEHLADIVPPIQCTGSEITDFSGLVVEFPCTPLDELQISIVGHKDGVSPEVSLLSIDDLKFKGGINLGGGEKILLRAAAEAILNTCVLP